MQRRSHPWRGDRSSPRRVPARNALRCPDICCFAWFLLGNTSVIRSGAADCAAGRMNSPPLTSAAKTSEVRRGPTGHEFFVDAAPPDARRADPIACRPPRRRSCPDSAHVCAARPSCRPEADRPNRRDRRSCWCGLLVSLSMKPVPGITAFRRRVVRRRGPRGRAGRRARHHPCGMAARLRSEQKRCREVPIFR